MMVYKVFKEKQESKGEWEELEKMVLMVLRYVCFDGPEVCFDGPKVCV